jgi:2,3-dihydroxy-p-cumate/2,3-dihydroxybenzoate 3,4-dioxygenase
MSREIGDRAAGETQLLAAVSYVRVAASNPPASAKFASEMFGLERVAELDGDFVLRSDDRFQTLTFSNGEPGTSSIGIEVRDEPALEQAFERLQAHGFGGRRATADECRRRFVMTAILAKDRSGNNIDLVARPLHSGRRYFPARDAGITAFQGVGLRSVHPDADLTFWKALGAQVSDWVGDIAYLRIDAHHHRLALYPAKGAGLLYAAFEVEALDNIMQNSYFMQERQVKVVQGPGRQPASGQIFLHVEGPDGIILSYVNGMERLEGSPRRTRQFPLVPASLCAWGSESRGVPELSADDNASGEAAATEDAS